MLGLVALAYPSLTGVRWGRVPHVFNVGYDVIEQSLASELSLMILLTLFVLKMLATSLTLGSGGSGGVFAPSLFMGAMLGGAFALVAESLFPSVPAPAGAYALVGMAAMFAACAHAPITAIIILFELTGDYRIMLPLMLTTVVATLAARKMLGGESIYSLKLARRGGQLSRGRDAALLAGVSVSEIMAHDVASVPSDVPIGELGEHFRRRRKTGLLVHGQPGVLAGVVTLSDLEKALERGDPATAAAGSIATQLEDLEIVNPDDTMGTALARMAARGVGRLPVVERGGSPRILGVVRRVDAIRAYQLASARQAEAKGDWEDSGRARHGDAAHFVDLRLATDDAAAGRSVRDVAPGPPPDSLLVAISRDSELIIPRGDTVLADGDRLTAFVRREHAEALIRAFKEGPEKEQR